MAHNLSQLLDEAAAAINPEELPCTLLVLACRIPEESAAGSVSRSVSSFLG